MKSSKSDENKESDKNEDTILLQPPFKASFIWRQKSTGGKKWLKKGKSLLLYQKSSCSSTKKNKNKRCHKCVMMS